MSEFKISALHTLLTLCLIFTLTVSSQAQKKNDFKKEVHKASKAPSIDGLANEADWQKAEWLVLDQRWLGEAYSAEDFSGRYKLLWTEDALHLYVEITDDILFDQYEDPLKLWWDDDCVEVFVDEDNSGGGHQYTHNAFAYHVALDYNVVDIGPGEIPHLYNDHIKAKRTLNGNFSTWELSIKVFDDSFKDGGKNTPVKLIKNKQVGFALAYCDNDRSKERENFIGSVAVEGEDKNRGWIDAGIFGTLILVD